MLSRSTSLIEEFIAVPDMLATQMARIVDMCCEQSVKAMFDKSSPAEPKVISQSHSVTIHDDKIYCTSIILYSY